MTTSRWPAGPLHPVQRRYLAEDLVRLRRSDEQRRYAAPQRAARVDPNPHQIEAVIFALARVREGGCILADEVGLGKTIETGLVIAQLLAEGARRVLLIAPKPLLGQWRQELFQLFDIEAREGESGGFTGDGVFLVGRELAGSQRGRDALLGSGRFDLCVIDEAHEVFAGIYKRFDAFGQYLLDAKDARTAARVREVLVAGGIPVLLLTATPIQNSLAELWGLVQYVDPLGTLLGDLPTFREVFCGGDDRVLARGQEDELRTRLKTVLQRTLRRQAKEFLEKPFVDRHARLFKYTMSPIERELYDDVTAYLLEPGIVAFQGRQRQLLLIGFHRRMASSTRALAASLERVASRLRAMLPGAPGPAKAEPEPEANAMLADLEDTDLDSGDDEGEAATPDEPPIIAGEAAVRRELQRVEGYIRRAELVVQDDSKLRALLQALAFVEDHSRRGKGAGKLVIFTESLVTQEHIRDRLIESGMVTSAEITLFRGNNDSPRAREALVRWREDVAFASNSRPSADMAVRLALVHEFQHRSRVFISTEAGAKGLNLQFCDTLVNYDLPWNPQRIEQRIGRCHRYGQRHPVTVINFLAEDNEAQQLTFEILSQKLELFGTVLDASDQVLHHGDALQSGILTSALGAELELELRKIYERSRTIDEVTSELRALRERIADERQRFEQTHARTAALIEKHFDEDVRRVFRLRQAELPLVLAELDRDLRHVVASFLEAREIPHSWSRRETCELLTVAPSEHLPPALRGGFSVAIGTSAEHGSLNLGHPLVNAAVADARAAIRSRPRVAIVPLKDAAPALEVHRGKRGSMRLCKLTFDGFERIERLVAVVLLEGMEHALDPVLAEALLRAEVRDAPDAEPPRVGSDDLDDATDELLFRLQREVDQAEQARFELAAQQAEKFIEDRLLVLRRRRTSLEASIQQSERKRDAATGSDARTEAERRILQTEVEHSEVQAAVERLERRDDATFQRFQDHIQRRRYTPPEIISLFEMELVVE
jgi:hypothetical protein